MTHKGARAISENATNRKIFVVCNSTSEMSKRAPHHEFWPSVYVTDKMWIIF